MIGPILIALSWVLLKFEKKSLSVLGFNKPILRIQQFALAFLVTGIVVVVQQLGHAFVSDNAWQLNAAFARATLLEHLRWNINSVLFEELIFRGYLLYQMIRWLGNRRAVLLNAAAFGVYHWFSYGIVGNPVMMAFIFVLTGAFGFMLALSFAKTESIAAPIGLHLGWNLISYVIFSKGPLGEALLVPANAEIEVNGFMGLLLNVGLPILMVGCVSWYLAYRYRVKGQSAA